MPLIKQPVAINFIKGLDTKSDPFQVQIGNFLALQNSVFNAAGRLTKRPGFDVITILPNTNETTLTTLNDNLIATGSNLYAYNADLNQWLNKGTIQPVTLSTESFVRSSTTQVSPDLAVSSNGIACLVYVDSGNAYYQISDSTSGQQIIPRVALSSTATNPRVFVLGVYFIITFCATVSGTPHLQYIALPMANPTMTAIVADISADVQSINTGYDAYSVNNTLYIAWGASSGNVKVTFLTSTLSVATAVTIGSSLSDLMSVTADIVRNRIFVSFWDNTDNNGYSTAFDYTLTQVMAKTQIINNTVITELTTIASNGVNSVFYENSNNYAFSGGAVSDFISKLTVTLPVSGTGSGTTSSTTVMLRSVGLASKPFVDKNIIYMLAAYGDINQSPASNDSNQPTYFLVDSSGNVYMRLAYSNGGGYASSQVLPTVTVSNGNYIVPYLITDFLATVNKGTNLPSGTPSNAIYTQTGINVATFSLDDTKQYSSEIAGALHLTGGQIWEYDGVKPVEFGFQVWPENVVVTTSTTGGNISDQQYFYVFTYEWTDNQGNLHRSAPSIPVTITTSGGNTSTNTIYVPTDRLTYKVSPNPIRIVGYRWSAAQQVYYQFTSITSPVINDTTTDYVTITDTLADSSILGQTLLYTTGGVIENIAPPASVASCLFNNRLFLIDAEDRNLLWFSKQVIESTPVEFSDLLTLFIAPTTGAQGSTGPMTALGAMDDKLIIFKKDAIYYINGTGPDNTGANSNFSDPVFITSSVGCSNPSSVVLMPNGIMFQSDKGIWLLDRSLATTYIGAGVEQYNNYVVKSAACIPGTNQVRFMLNNNITLMYDYFYQQWATHTNTAGISATLYQGLFTYLNSYGQVFQENSDSFIDGSVPVLMSLTTSWINIAGLQGYERFYFGNLLGTYFTPFKLDVLLTYDYNPSAIQSVTVLPSNYTLKYGQATLYGNDTYGGPGNVFSARFFPIKQKCESFQVTIQEVYDASLGIAAGQGLSLSGLSLTVGVKKGTRTQSARKSFG